MPDMPTPPQPDLSAPLSLQILLLTHPPETLTAYAQPKPIPRAAKARLERLRESLTLDHLVAGFEKHAAWKLPWEAIVRLGAAIKLSQVPAHQAKWVARAYEAFMPVQLALEQEVCLDLLHLWSPLDSHGTLDDHLHCFEKTHNHLAEHINSLFFRDRNFKRALTLLGTLAQRRGADAPYFRGFYFHLSLYKERILAEHLRLKTRRAAALAEHDETLARSYLRFSPYHDYHLRRGALTAPAPSQFAADMADLLGRMVSAAYFAEFAGRDNALYESVLDRFEIEVLSDAVPPAKPAPATPAHMPAPPPGQPAARSCTASPTPSERLYSAIIPNSSRKYLSTDNAQRITYFIDDLFGAAPPAKLVDSLAAAFLHFDLAGRQRGAARLTDTQFRTFFDYATDLARSGTYIRPKHLIELYERARAPEPT